jgi:hypothetical protein
MKPKNPLSVKTFSPDSGITYFVFLKATSMKRTLHLALFVVLALILLTVTLYT